MVQPDQNLVLTVPPDARLSRIEIRRIVKGCMSSSWLTPELTSALMWSFRVVYQAQATLGSTLDSTKPWNKLLTEAPPCNCHRYPSHWPKRHGHLFIPSWQYTGPFKDTVTSLMSCTVKKEYSPRQLFKAIAIFWNKHFPSNLCGRIIVPTKSQYQSQSGPLSSQIVQAARSYLSHLAVIGIDKCSNRKLLLCPTLYAKSFTTRPSQLTKTWSTSPQYQNQFRNILDGSGQYTTQKDGQRSLHSMLDTHPNHTRCSNLKTYLHPVSRYRLPKESAVEVARSHPTRSIG